MPSRSTFSGRLAYSHCKGVGLEIGALHDPFELDATVLYLDRFGIDELKEAYKGDAREPYIKPVTFIAKSTPYSFISDCAFDFVASSHVLEHFPNPGLAIEEWIRVVKAGGIVYSVIPNKHMTFDRPRNVTPVGLLLDAYKRRDPIAPYVQYEDYYLLREIAPTAERPDQTYIRRKFEAQDSIHVYTFTPETTLQYLEELKTYIPFEVICFEIDGNSIHFALKKRIN